MSTPFVMKKDAYGNRSTNIAPISDNINNLYFSAAGWSIIDVPSWAGTFAMDGTVSSCAVKYNATEYDYPKIPTADKVDGTGVEVGPTLIRHFPPGSISTIGVAVPEAGWITILFYE